MVRFELWVHLVLVLQGGVDGMVLVAGCLIAFDASLKMLIGCWAGGCVVNQSNKFSFVSIGLLVNNWLEKLVFIGEYFQYNSRILIKPVLDELVSTL